MRLPLPLEVGSTRRGSGPGATGWPDWFVEPAGCCLPAAAAGLLLGAEPFAWTASTPTPTRAAAVIAATDAIGLTRLRRSRADDRGAFCCWLVMGRMVPER